MKNTNVQISALMVYNRYALLNAPKIKKIKYILYVYNPLALYLSEDNTSPQRRKLNAIKLRMLRM